MHYKALPGSKNVHKYFVWHSFTDSLDIFLDFYLVSYLLRKDINWILTATPYPLSQLFHQNSCYDFVIHSLISVYKNMIVFFNFMLEPLCIKVIRPVTMIYTFYRSRKIIILYQHLILCCNIYLKFL